MARDPLRELLALRELEARCIVGLISGTSADGIDAALCEVRGSGEATRVRALAFETVPIEAQIKHRIWSLPDGAAQNVCGLNFLLGEAFARAALAVIARAGVPRAEVHLIGSHGQTARHQPPGPGVAVPSTLQIAEGAVIAERTGLPVVCDFRVADVAAGGHGAPLIPLVDYLLFRHPTRVRALLNLGGIANITLLGATMSEVLAFDTGPANMALDAVARAASGGETSFDRDGALAAAGHPDRALLDELLAHPYFALPPPKSTGRELFGRGFVYPLLDRYAGRLADLQATLVELTAESIGLAVERFLLPRGAIAELLVSGGGVHNPCLMARLAARLGRASIAVASLAEAGMDPDAKEAIGFAVLANETLHCHQGNIPSATGARGPRVLGKLVLPPLEG
jgi:anhydro-N-acetylmuramic acid kinase